MVNAARETWGESGCGKELVSRGEPGAEFGGGLGEPLQGAEKAEEGLSGWELSSEIGNVEQSGGHSQRGVGEREASGCGGQSFTEPSDFRGRGV